MTESVDATVEAIKKAAKAQADSEYKAEQQQTYVDLLKEQSSLEQQIAEAEANLDAERQRRGMRQDDVTGDWVSGSGFWMEDSPWVAWTSDIDDYKKSLEELQAAYDENQQTLSDIEGEWRGVAQAVEDAQNQTVTYDEAVSMATSSAQSALDRADRSLRQGIRIGPDEHRGTNRSVRHDENLVGTFHQRYGKGHAEPDGLPQPLL